MVYIFRIMLFRKRIAILVIVCGNRLHCFHIHISIFILSIINSRLFTGNFHSIFKYCANIYFTSIIEYSRVSSRYTNNAIDNGFRSIFSTIYIFRIMLLRKNLTILTIVRGNRLHCLHIHISIFILSIIYIRLIASEKVVAILQHSEYIHISIEVVARRYIPLLAIDSTVIAKVCFKYYNQSARFAINGSRTHTLSTNSTSDFSITIYFTTIVFAIVRIVIYIFPLWEGVNSSTILSQIGSISKELRNFDITSDKHIITSYQRSNINFTTDFRILTIKCRYCNFYLTSDIFNIKYFTCYFHITSVTVNEVVTTKTSSFNLTSDFSITIYFSTIIRLRIGIIIYIFSLGEGINNFTLLQQISSISKELRNFQCTTNSFRTNWCRYD